MTPAEEAESVCLHIIEFLRNTPEDQSVGLCIPDTGMGDKAAEIYDVLSRCLEDPSNK